MQADGSVTQTSRMGRIDSEIGRKMAARDAAEAEKKRIAEEKAAAVAAEKAAKAAEKAAKEQAAAAAAMPAPPAAEVPAAAEASQTDETATGSTSLLGRVGKRITNIF